MATTEMDSGSSEIKSEQGTADLDSKYPLKVLYCGGIVYKLIFTCINIFLYHFVCLYVLVLLFYCSVLPAYGGELDFKPNVQCYGVMVDELHAVMQGCK